MEEKPVEPDIEEEKSTTPEGREKDPTPTGKSSKKSDKGSKTDRARKSSARSKAGRRSSLAASPPPGAQTPASETDTRYVLLSYTSMLTLYGC